MSQWLRANSALLEDPNLVPRINIGWLTTVCFFTPGDQISSFSMCRSLNSHIYTHINTNKNKKMKNLNKNKNLKNALYQAVMAHAINPST